MDSVIRLTPCCGLERYKMFLSANRTTHYPVLNTVLHFLFVFSDIFVHTLNFPGLYVVREIS